ncbi:molecular chaperone TorD family protein [Adlercreutzia faecimuris]|uniref:Molecular chaperone TorD family protein n=1 Tax=Adlercreutzia faecimuris TaxID=2897341 RepID=A0ABS9WEB2_9ACTN|nr:molecular chaperone TorD family protein [Adlercreutzia sp. JBNU-10]MCI2241203.1 molecular chaperone TorD family protein [Adlercreutzia sp. JBNU-10]
MDSRIVSDELPEDRELQSLGVAAVLDACAAVFLSRPDEPVVAAVRHVARALGDDRFDDVTVDADLAQRFDDRLLVAVSPWYVPLTESCVRGAWQEDGRWRYGTVDGPEAIHVQRCYQAVGFDHRALPGDEVTVAALAPDALGAELAFTAFLLRSAAELEERDPEGAAHALGLARQFVHAHLGAWADTAAECLAWRGDDLYARTAALAADVVALIA